jgi:hypothetical protein
MRSSTETAMPTKRPGQDVEDQNTQQCSERGDEIDTGSRSVDASEIARVHVVEPSDRREVNQLDERGDDDRGKGRFGEVFEKAGEQQQCDHGHHSDDESRELRSCAGTAVDRGLREAAVHDHAAAQTCADVGCTQPDKFAVRVDLVVVTCRVVLPPRRGRRRSRPT